MFVGICEEEAHLLGPSCLQADVLGFAPIRAGLRLRCHRGRPRRARGPCDCARAAPAPLHQATPSSPRPTDVRALNAARSCRGAASTRSRSEPEQRSIAGDSSVFEDGAMPQLARCATAGRQSPWACSAASAEENNEPTERYREGRRAGFVGAARCVSTDGQSNRNQHRALRGRRRRRTGVRWLHFRRRHLGFNRPTGASGEPREGRVACTASSTEAIGGSMRPEKWLVNRIHRYRRVHGPSDHEGERHLRFPHHRRRLIDPPGKQNLRHLREWLPSGCWATWRPSAIVRHRVRLSRHSGRHYHRATIEVTRR